MGLLSLTSANVLCFLKLKKNLIQKLVNAETKRERQNFYGSLHINDRVLSEFDFKFEVINNNYIYLLQ